ADIDRLLKLDSENRALVTQQQTLTAEKNQISKQIGPLAGKLKKAPDAEKAALQAQMKQLQDRPPTIKVQERALEQQIAALQPQTDELLLRVPQPADDEVPLGRDDSGNVERKKWGEVRKFDFAPKDHVALGQDLGIIDVERGVKLAGSRSYFL